MKNTKICLIGFKSCKETLKAKTWLDLQKISYNYVDISKFIRQNTLTQNNNNFVDIELNKFLHYLSKNISEIFSLTDVDTHRMDHEMHNLFDQDMSISQLPFMLFCLTSSFSLNKQKNHLKMNILKGFDAHRYFDAFF